MRYILLAALALAALLSTSCAATPNTPAAGGSSADPMAAPASGKAKVVGRVTDSKTGAALSNTTMRLAEVYRSGGDGAYVLDGGRSPGAVSDAEGNFVFNDIEAREYVLVVAPTEEVVNTIVIADETGKAKVWNAEAGKVLNVGVVAVDLGAASASSN